MRVLPVLLLLVLPGCYGYFPVNPGTPVDGARIRVYPSDQRVDELTGPRGPMVSQLEGFMIETNRDSLQVFVEAVRTNAGISQVWEGRELWLPQSRIARLEARRFSRGRTILFVGAMIGGGVLLDHWFGWGIAGKVFDNDENAPGTPPT